MPEDAKKNQQKGKNEPKDQRKRRGRQNAAPVEKKGEKEPEKPKVTVPDKPIYEPPPPEFYQNLKRETDEILKITEEANSKYKKKEIQSNWAKYEMPIESYEDMDEQENLGADYEALSQAPLVVGGHFQFKHEKSWDITNGPSPYDKYFDINTENLSTALSTIPFYERNSIDVSFFNENDIQNMNHKANKCKYKYYNDKKYATPEIIAQDKIFNSLKSNNIDSIENGEDDKTLEAQDRITKDINLEECEVTIQSGSKLINTLEINTSNILNDELCKVSKLELDDNSTDNGDDTKITVNKTEKVTNTTTETKSDVNKVIDNDFEEFVHNDVEMNSKSAVENEIKVHGIPDLNLIDNIEKAFPNASSCQNEATSSTKNPIIESPEDLEKWLDDFLDG